MPKKRESTKEPKWRNSAARKLLEDDLINGVIPLKSSSENGMSPKDVYLQRPEFAEFSYEYF